MLYIGKNQSTEEFMVEYKDGSRVPAARTELSCTYSAVEIKDTEDREESAERANWNQDQYQPDKKTPEVSFII